jgi:hypothetical protein
MSNYTVSTVEALEALPDLTVVIDKHGDVSQKRGSGEWCTYESAPMTSRRLAKYGPVTVLYTPQGV